MRRLFRQPLYLPVYIFLARLFFPQSINKIDWPPVCTKFNLKCLQVCEAALNNSHSARKLLMLGDSLAKWYRNEKCCSPIYLFPICCFLSANVLRTQDPFYKLYFDFLRLVDRCVWHIFDDDKHATFVLRQCTGWHTDHVSSVCTCGLRAIWEFPLRIGSWSIWNCLFALLTLQLKLERLHHGAPLASLAATWAGPGHVCHAPAQFQMTVFSASQIYLKSLDTSNCPCWTVRGAVDLFSLNEHLNGWRKHTATNETEWRRRIRKGEKNAQ